MRRTVSTRTSLGLAIALLLAMPVHSWAQECLIHIIDYNSERYVFGDVNTECSWPHTVPWGNWGVSSMHGSQYDGFQFAGWKRKDGWRQWNSCTGDYPPPDSIYYNYENYYTQIYTGTNRREYAQWWSDYVPWSCADTMSGGVYTITNNFMQVWELDKPDSDDLNATLYYPNINVTMSCGGGYCSGESGWTRPSSGDGDMTAKIKMFVEMWDY